MEEQILSMLHHLIQMQEESDERLKFLQAKVVQLEEQNDRLMDRIVELEYKL